ncbi:MAG: hypothetical protein HFJ94_04175 [Muribaculaceae bacterium]|nr:hypothetical protein [Muribaculaceae bacterium]
MKKIFAIPFLCLTAVIAATSCSDDSAWDTYEDWRKDNDTYYQQQVNLKDLDGSAYYTPLAPSWYPTSGVLIHYFNDRSKTEGNLVPLVTSTVDVKYKGWLYNGTPFDSSYTATTYGDSIFRFRPTETIAGWQIALTNMAVGDSARVVIPWAQGYGTETSGLILPFSTLTFDIKLVDIAAYETNDN